MTDKIKHLYNRTKTSFLPIVLIVIIFTFIVFYLLFAADSKFEDNDNVVKLYFADNISVAHTKTIEHFNEKYEGRIKVIPVDLPFNKFSTNERKELLTRSLRSKSDKLDIFAVDHIWIRRFARWTRKLNEDFRSEELDRFVPNAVEPCIIEGDLYAIPLYVDIGVMYYRADLFNSLIKDTSVIAQLKNSINWDDFIKLGSKFKNPYYLFPADSYEGLVCSYMEMVLNQNRDFFNEENIDLTRPESRKALSLLVDLVNKYKVSPEVVTNFKETGAFRYFFDEKGIFLRGWPGLDHDIYNLKIKEDTTLNIVKLPLPHFKGTEPAYIIGGWNLMISKYSTNPKEAMIFLNYLISQESQLIMFDQANYLPVIKEIYENEELVNRNADLKYYYSLFEHGVHRPFLEDYTRVSDIISYHLNKAIKGEITIDEALSNATKMIEEERVLIK